MDYETPFETMLERLITGKYITTREVFRLAFMALCDRNPQGAKEFEDNYFKNLGRETRRYDFFKGYVVAVFDEVAERQIKHEATP